MAVTSIEVDVVTTVSVNMTLTKFDADRLVYFLKTACAPPIPADPGNLGSSDIVHRLAINLEQGMKK